MNKLLSSLDQCLVKIVKVLMTLCMVILTAIVFIQVVARYVLKMSVGGIAELPVYLMILTVWLAAIMIARENTHIRLEVIEAVIKNKKALRCIEIFVILVTIIVLAVFAYLSLKYVKFGIETGDTTAGLKFPLWWLTSFLFLSSLLMCIYYLAIVFRKIKEFGK